MPIKPETPELDRWNKFQNTTEYSVLEEFINKLLATGIEVDEITEGKVYPKNHILVFGEHPRNYRADIYMVNRGVDEIISLYKEFNWDMIKEQQAALDEYHECVRTQNQKFDSFR